MNRAPDLPVTSRADTQFLGRSPAAGVRPMSGHRNAGSSLAVVAPRDGVLPSFRSTCSAQASVQAATEQVQDALPAMPSRVSGAVGPGPVVRPVPEVRVLGEARAAAVEPVPAVRSEALRDPIRRARALRPVAAAIEAIGWSADARDVRGRRRCAWLTGPNCTRRVR